MKVCARLKGQSQGLFHKNKHAKDPATAHSLHVNKMFDGVFQLKPLNIKVPLFSVVLS